MDTAGHVLVEAHHLYARNSTSSTSAETATRPAAYKAVGIILAVCSGLFIGVSFVIKKVGLLKANEKYNEVAGEGYGYLKNAWWWLGMSTMIVGEICNFVAYAFVDAILVTPFGALSVVITTVLSAIFLKERLSFVGKVGCFQCVIGAVVIAINAPEQSAAATIQEMQAYVIAPGFLSYAGVIVLAAAFTAFWVAPRWGKKSMFVYISICSFIGGLSVVATQGLGAAIVAQISGTDTNQFKQWFLYVLLVFVIITLLTEIIYLNKALNLFNAALVTPTYYVMFTSATIITSAILFRGFHGTIASITTVIMGFLFICSGVVLLQLAKSSKDVPDTAIFQGDLDQMRTIAEQEEPESEPRADTIRGGAAIVRAISRKRTMRQLDEVKTIHSEHMDPINEDEPVYFDGLRRRKTVIAPGQRSIRRAKTVHPPLGMSSFPDEDGHSEAGSVETDYHPGFHLPKFMGRQKSKAKSTASSDRGALTEMSDLETGVMDKDASQVATHERNQSEHVYGLPPGLRHEGAADFDEDTSYRPGPSSPHINFASDLPHQSLASSLLEPPKPPPHASTTPGSGSGIAKRTFSFQNPFSRLNKNRRGDDASDDEDTASTASSDRRPLSRSAFSYQRNTSYSRPPTQPQATEEERLGLVKGDSGSPSASRTSPLTDAMRGGYAGVISEEDESDGWLVTSGRSESPEDLAGDLGRARMRERESSSRGMRYDDRSDSEDEAEGLTYVKPRMPSGL